MAANNLSFSNKNIQDNDSQNEGDHNKKIIQNKLDTVQTVLLAFDMMKHMENVFYGDG